MSVLTEGLLNVKSFEDNSGVNHNLALTNPKAMVNVR
jgi:hypothetical protein